MGDKVAQDNARVVIQTNSSTTDTTGMLTDPNGASHREELESAPAQDEDAERTLVDQDEDNTSQGNANTPDKSRQTIAATQGATGTQWTDDRVPPSG